jgi:acyl carrier protein
VEQILVDRLRDLVVTQLGLETDQVYPDARILDLGADSLDVVELVMALEETFAIEVPDADVETLVTLRDVAAYVEKRLSPR